MAENKSWQQDVGEKAIDSLAKKGLINKPDDWKAKNLKDELAPLWLIFELMNNATKK